MSETPRVVSANPEFGWFSIDDAFDGDPHSAYVDPCSSDCPAGRRA